MSAETPGAACFSAAVALAIIVAVLSLPLSPARGDDEAIGPREAIEKASALEREGRTDDAYTYLYELVAADGDLAGDARVLMELSRLSPTAEESVELLERACVVARNGATESEARGRLGDYLYARASYLEAVEQYAMAAKKAPDDRKGALLLKRAAAILAAGDAAAASDAYRSLKERGSAPDETTPWAMLGLGRALLARGDFGGAAREFEELAQAYVEHEARPRALAGAAEARRALGHNRLAREALQHLIAEYSGTYEAVLAREDLRSLPADTASAMGPFLPEEAETATQ